MPAVRAEREQTAPPSPRPLPASIIMDSTRPLGLATALLLLSSLPVPSALARPQDTCVTRRLSLDTSDGNSDGISRKPALSADGLWVAFESSATDLVPGDTNGFVDIFVREIETGATELVSLPTGGGQGDGDSYHTSISNDGRFVIFESDATNLVVGDTNAVRDVFVVDRQLDTLVRVSVDSDGQQASGPSGTRGLWRGSTISGDGRLAVFQSVSSDLVFADTNSLSDIFVHDLLTGATTRANMSVIGGPPIQANGSSQDPAISSDGLYVAYRSSANNLVPGDTNGASDIFRTRLSDLSTMRASSSTGGTQANSSCGQPCLSADGNRVAFESFADNIVAGDTNGQIDIFLHDFTAQTTERVSLTWDGQQASGYAQGPAISANGMRVAFTGNSIELIPSGSGIQSVYVRDLGAATTERWGEDSAGGIGFAGSSNTSFSANGERLAFLSLAALEPADTNSLHDIYLRECSATGSTYCPGLADTCPCANGGDGESGCSNTSGTGALLQAEGVQSVFADSVLLTASGLPATVPVLFFQGTNALNGVTFGAGLRCVGGMTRRLGIRFASGGVATFGFPGDTPLSIRGSIPATGGTRHYQGWYRDGMATCTTTGFNLTNGLTIQWVP